MDTPERLTTASYFSIKKRGFQEMPPPSAQLPLWVEWAKALGPAFVSALAVFISVLTLRLQAHTSRDQLRFNLFEKRYAIYEGAQNLIKLLVNKSVNPEGHEVIQYYALLDEAHFVFPDDICDWLSELREHSKNLLIARASGASPKEVTAQTTRLVDLLSQMPRRFERQLGFRR